MLIWFFLFWFDVYVITLSTCVSLLMMILPLYMSCCLIFSLGCYVLFSVSTMIFIVFVLSLVSGASVSTSACFPASIVGCVMSERFYLCNRCHQVGKTVPTGFRKAFLWWFGSWCNHLLRGLQQWWKYASLSYHCMWHCRWVLLVSFVNYANLHSE